MKEALPALGAGVQMVSLDVDPSESADQLRRFAERNGFGWRLAIAPPDVLRELERAFGPQFLTPPTEPMFLVDTAGRIQPTAYGHRDGATLRRLVDAARR